MASSIAPSICLLEPEQGITPGFQRSSSHSQQVSASSSSCWMSLNQDTSAIRNLVEFLSASISEIIESISQVELEEEIFTEIGCYLYRASPAIMELQTTKNTPENAMDILQSLSSNIDLAKDLVNKCQNGTNSVSDSELKSIIAQLEGVIKHMGESLSLIPSSTFKDQEYAEVAVQSLANEMRSAHFEVGETQVSQPEVLEPQLLSSEEQPGEEVVAIDSDLYSVNVEVSTNDLQVLNMPHLIEFVKSTNQRSQKKPNSSGKSSIALPQVARSLEPPYETFLCPLTKEIMDDPVTVESGVTYERKAITDWFQKFESSEEILCPSTGKKLMTRTLSRNIALKTTIEEWKERNEVARIKVARAALSLGSSASMVLEAIEDLQDICQRRWYNKVQVRNIGVLPFLVNILEYNDRNVRVAAVELLQQLAEDDDDNKEVIADKVNLPKLIKLLSSGHQPIRHASLLLLLELSKSQSLHEKIGSATGGILMLITMKYNHFIDAFASEKADEILRNLGNSSNNIKCMAENGFLEPLLCRLTEGCEEMQMEMASYLGEIALGHDSKTYVAEKASPALIKMVHSGNSLTRKAAFKALAEISSYHPNAKILAEAGIIQIMVEEMFNRRIYNEPMDTKTEATAILANILESGLEIENLQVNTRGHRMASDYVVYNFVDMLKNSTPDELNVKLIRILLCLTKTPKSTATFVSLVKETEVSYTLIEFINNPHEELGVAAIKLLITISPYIGHTLIERLCKTSGLPENLILRPRDTTQITEKQAVSAKFLANLPHQNLTLNIALLSKNIVPTILQAINRVQRSGTRTSRYASSYLEGLVGILVRFTTTLYEPQILLLARNHNFTLVFTDLLMKGSSDEVQKLSAIGLENLSSESVNLSRPPEIKRTKFLKSLYLPKFMSFRKPKRKQIPVCPVHRGACSSQNTFCLVEANAVERLLGCLYHENAEVVEAALSAICTLLDDKVDLGNSVNMLDGVNTIQHVLNVVKEHREEGLWQKSFWVIEKFLMKGGDKSTADISRDRLLPATLVSAFHHGEGNTRQMAEKILRHLNKMPNISTSGYTL